MKSFRDYWTFSAIRGSLTMVVAIGILFTQRLATGIMPVPILLGLAIDIIAVYLLLDCGAMFLLSQVLPKGAKGRYGLYVQMAGSLVLGGVLFAMTAERIDAKYLAGLIALQAALAATAEWSVAKATNREYHCLSCFSTTLVLVACALGLPLLTGMDAETMSIGLAGYVGVFGLTQMLVGGRMLFKEYRAEHPATLMVAAWGNRMEAIGAEPARTAKECGVCEACPAVTSCRDYSLTGQLAKVSSARVPSIVRTVRAATLVGAAQRG